MSVAGGGLKGAVQSYARMPPTPQASMQDLADLIEPGAFSGVEALIIGGSRGLGEVTAKLLAAGGREGHDQLSGRRRRGRGGGAADPRQRRPMRDARL